MHEIPIQTAVVKVTKVLPDREFCLKLRRDQLFNGFAEIKIITSIKTLDKSCNYLVNSFNNWYNKFYLY